ncbi:HPr family phosphocarrier protein [Roseburia sp. 499]|uniref:HPr family phosphocarrier protein n=1 Tax=Roseburia sp. 499 TaxID=1261634 RepID=UPI000951912C|nr:HPr family phosphocarrier protein [Roseburia sp. 499]WVK70664.1 HPr family phosphocarrier protein [Roseburia sp. 499]
MKTFQYKITEEVGIHARPAGLLTKAAKECGSKVTISSNGKSADATKLMAVMSLGVKCFDEVTVTVEGENEEEAAAQMEKFFKENL